jgi:GH25 family lysozyme M1 (1,4-beta-N-acetylmuramidase)
MIKAIDVSCWQVGVDYNKVKNSGINVVLIRAGFGREASQKDSQFENHYRGAKAAGLKIGVYWYSYADSISDAVNEANACLACLNGRKLDLPVYYDLEEPWQQSFGRATLTTIAEKFCDTIKKHGYRAGVYANAYWFSQCLNYSTLRNKYSIWLAQWASSHSIKCDIWQYSESGGVNGVSGNVDMNIIENPSIIDGSDTIPTTDIPDTATVQRWLNKVYNSGLVVDNIYGVKTRTAIIKGLQNVLNVKYHANLVVDGIFGRATKAAVRPLQRGAYGGYPSILQAFLICRGYDTGGFDGDFGIKTEAAVKKFQTDNHLTVDGIAGKDTFSKLAE